MALKRSPTATTSDGATNRNTAFGSTKRRISQGQAMRSIFGRARVTQTVRPCASRVGQFLRRHQRQLGGLPAFKAALQRFGCDVEMPSQAAVPSASFWPRRQTTMAERPENSRPQSAASLMAAPDRAGNQPGIGGKILVGADVDQGRGVRRADQPSKFVSRYRCEG